MRKETVTELVLEYESCRVRYDVKDVPLGSTCMLCDLRGGEVSGEVKVMACDRYACSPLCRGDRRNVVFVRRRVRGER